MGRIRRAALLLLAAALLPLGGCARQDQPARQHKVAMVVKSTQTEFWLSVFAGAEAAAAEYNVELSTMGPATEEDYGTQNQMIAEAVADGAEALVFSAIDFERNASAVDAAGQAGVKIVSIDSGVGSDLVSTYIGTDNHAAGRMAAQAALEQTEGPLVVGLVNYDEGTANGQERELGVREALEESGRARVAASVNTLAEAGRAQADTADLLRNNPEVNVLIAFNEPTSVGAARAVEELGLEDQVFLVGFDSNVAAIEGLQTGSVDALVVQNPYAMGYLGVESAYRLLAGQAEGLAPTVDTSTQIVSRSNLFTLDSQKALFAFE